MLAHVHTSRLWFAMRNSLLLLRTTACPGSEPGAGPGAAKYPGPLCTLQVLPFASQHPVSRRQELPRLRRSYGPMRQTKSLSPPTVVALVDESLQVIASPCWEMALPDVISAILVWVLGPLPRGVPSVLWPVTERT